MPALDNRTKLSILDFISVDKDAAQRLVVCVAATYGIKAKRGEHHELHLLDGQAQPPLVDEYFGEPQSSSLRSEGQAAYTRPGTDVYVQGHAWAASGKPALTVMVGLKLGALSKSVTVIGDRWWRRDGRGLQPTKPKPFVSLPLRYEHAFGGVSPGDGDLPPSFDQRNPVGRGFYASAREACDQPLPNCEDALCLIRSPQDRPEPAGLGPVARSWLPRVGLCGTYDEAWVKQRAPLWPHDFDERFFCAAASGLTAYPYLRGGEPVELTGLSPDGAMRFLLPQHHLTATAKFRDHEQCCPCMLDAVHIDTDERRVMLIWRASIPVHRRLVQHEVTVVQSRTPGEATP